MVGPQISGDPGYYLFSGFGFSHTPSSTADGSMGKDGSKFTLWQINKVWWYENRKL